MLITAPTKGMGGWSGATPREFLQTVMTSANSRRGWGCFSVWCCGAGFRRRDKGAPIRMNLCPSDEDASAVFLADFNRDIPWCFALLPHSNLPHYPITTPSRPHRHPITQQAGPAQQGPRWHALLPSPLLSLALLLPQAQCHSEGGAGVTRIGRRGGGEPHALTPHASRPMTRRGTRRAPFPPGGRGMGRAWSLRTNVGRCTRGLRAERNALYSRGTRSGKCAADGVMARDPTVNPRKLQQRGRVPVKGSAGIEGDRKGPA